MDVPRKSNKGSTVTELAEISQLSRSAVRTALIRLEKTKLYIVNIIINSMVNDSNSPEKKILQILRNSSGGKTITELTDLSQLSRSTVRIALARLDGAKKITLRKVGMAKIYSV